VRWFLVVGGASGTVAKSISAYDKEVSDDLYGSGARYVSRERLEAMLDSEWTQLIKQLNKSCGSSTRFFSFVDTISPATTLEQQRSRAGPERGFARHFWAVAGGGVNKANTNRNATAARKCENNRRP
jgi:hypothetical protein